MSAAAVLAVSAMSAIAGCAADRAGPTAANPRPSMSATPAPGPGGYPATVRVGTLPPLRVEVADTAAERDAGLSGRARLPRRTGLLFRFEQEVTVGFWMYDVGFPLSLAWVRDGRVIGTVEMTPCTTGPDECPSYEPPGPYDLAIEAPAGTFAEVRPGTRVRVRTGPASP